MKAVVHESKEEHVLDRSLGSCPANEVNQVFNVALNCLETDPMDRPMMTDVVKMLEQIKLEKDGSVYASDTIGGY